MAVDIRRNRPVAEPERDPRIDTLLAAGYKPVSNVPTWNDGWYSPDLKKMFMDWQLAWKHYEEKRVAEEIHRSA